MAEDRPERRSTIFKDAGILWLLDRNAYVDPSFPVLRRMRGIHTDPAVSCLEDAPLKTIYAIPPDGSREFGLQVEAYRSGLSFPLISLFFGGSPAYREWRAARKLSRLGVSAPTSVAFGHATNWRPGEISDYVVTVRIPDSAPLGETVKVRFAEGRREPVRWRTFVRRFAEFIRGVHDRGVRYGELEDHSILVSGESFHLADLSGISFSGRLTRGRVLGNLSAAWRILTGPASRQDLLRFAGAYLGTDDLRRAKRLAGAIARGTASLARRRAESAAALCLSGSGGFQKRAIAGFRCFHGKDASPAEIMAALLAYHAGQVREVLSSSKRTRVAVVAGPGRLLCVKEFRNPGIFNLLEAFFGSARARRAWVGANGLLARGIRTVPPVALLEILGLTGPARGYLLTEFLEGVLPLSQYVKRRLDAGGPPLTAAERRSFAKSLARFVRYLHSVGIYHSDLSPKNFLVKQKGERDWEFSLLDLDALRFWRKLTPRRRLKGLSQLNDLPVRISASDRLRFWVEYWGRGREYPRREFGIAGKMTETRNA